MSKLKRGWKEVWIKQNAPFEEHMAMKGNTVVPWSEAPMEPEDAPKKRKDDGKETLNRILRPTPCRLFPDGARVCFKDNPELVFTVKCATFSENVRSPIWFYVLEGYGTGIVEDALAYAPHYPLGTWRDTIFGPAPISGISWRESRKTWAYTSVSKGVGVYPAVDSVPESEVRVVPPDPSYHWPKGCGPLPGTKVRVVEHLADSNGMALPVNSNSGKVFVVEKVCADQSVYLKIKFGECENCRWLWNVEPVEDKP